VARVVSDGESDDGQGQFQLDEKSAPKADPAPPADEAESAPAAPQDEPEDFSADEDDVTML
jgi:hypothetical protein